MNFNNPLKLVAGDIVNFGVRVPGGIEQFNGVVMPMGGSANIYVFSDFDHDVMCFTRRKNGKYISERETRDDPKNRLALKKFAASEFFDVDKNQTHNDPKRAFSDLIAKSQHWHQAYLTA